MSQQESLEMFEKLDIRRAEGGRGEWVWQFQQNLGRSQSSSYTCSVRTVSILLDSEGFLNGQDPKQVNVTSKLALFWARGLDQMATSPFPA